MKVIKIHSYLNDLSKSKRVIKISLDKYTQVLAIIYLFKNNRKRSEQIFLTAITCAIFLTKHLRLLSFV